MVICHYVDSRWIDFHTIFANIQFNKKTMENQVNEYQYRCWHGEKFYAIDYVNWGCYYLVWDLWHFIVMEWYKE